MQYNYNRVGYKSYPIKNLLIPIQISKTPDKTFQMFSGICDIDNIFLPRKVPILKNAS